MREGAIEYGLTSNINEWKSVKEVRGKVKVATEKGMYEVLWPRGRKTVNINSLAKRLDTLEGKTVCTLWDGAFRGEMVFPLIGKELAKRYPGIKFVGYDAFGCIIGENERDVLASMPDKLKQHKCDAVISGIGC